MRIRPYLKAVAHAGARHIETMKIKASHPDGPLHGRPFVPLFVLSVLFIAGATGCHRPTSMVLRDDFESTIEIEQIAVGPQRLPSARAGNPDPPGALGAPGFPGFGAPSDSQRSLAGIVWEDPTPLLAPKKNPPTPRRSVAHRASPEMTSMAPDVVAPAPSGPAETAASLGSFTKRLRNHIHGMDRPAIRKALDLALLSMVDKQPFDPQRVSDLSPEEIQQVRRYERLMAGIRSDLTAAEPRFDRKSIGHHLENLFDAQPIRIHDVQLVRSVESFGVYEPFAGNEFLALRENPMIVYLELEDFQVAETAVGRFAVQLAQEIELYTESGASSTKVWHQPEQIIVDECRNRRRDFFIRQLIRLPRLLSVGKYLLKVRVRDLTSHTVAERSVPIVLVADHRLAGASKTR